MFFGNKFKRIISSAMALAMTMMLAPVSVAAVDNEPAANDPNYGISGNGTEFGVNVYDAEVREDGNNNYMQFSTKWDTNNFYVQIEIGDTNVIDGDAVEISIDPTKINPSADTVDISYEVGETPLSGVAYEETENGYMITATIPFTDLNLTVEGQTHPYEGDVLWLEVVNTDVDTEDDSEGATLSWNAIGTDGPVCLYMNNKKPIISNSSTQVYSDLTLNGEFAESEGWNFINYGDYKIASFYNNRHICFALEAVTLKTVYDGASSKRIEFNFDANTNRFDDTGKAKTAARHDFSSEPQSGNLNNADAYSSYYSKMTNTSETEYTNTYEVAVNRTYTATLQHITFEYAAAIPMRLVYLGQVYNKVNGKWDEYERPSTFGTLFCVGTADYIDHVHSFGFVSEDEAHMWVCSDEECDSVISIGECYGGTATCNELAICDVCGEEYGEYTDHDVAVDADWVSDKANHWKECSLCGEPQNEAPHETDPANPNVCTICQAQGLCGSNTSSQWTVNPNNPEEHWHECTCVLGGHDSRAHRPGDWELVLEATEDNPGLEMIFCKDCEEELDEREVPYESEEEEEEGRGITWLLMLLFSKKYTITAEAGEGGTISSVGDTKIRFNRDLEYTITPNSGYSIEAVYVDGEDVGAVSSYTFDNVRKDHTIKVTFKKN